MKSILEKWKTDYDFKTFTGAAVSFAATLAFALYNGLLGLLHSSLWYGTICVYYIVLVFLRGSIILAEKRIFLLPDCRKSRSRVYVGAAWMLLLLNLSLIVPVSMLVRLQKPVKLTLIPAVAMAAYTTYKMIIASVNLRRRKRTANSLARLLRAINFIDALVSVIALQNTLIMLEASDGEAGLMPLSAVSGGFILLMILVMSFAELVKSLRGLKSGK